MTSVTEAPPGRRVRRAAPGGVPQQRRARSRVATVVAVGVLLAAGLLAAGTGPAGLPVGGVLAELGSRIPGLGIEPTLTEREATILWQLRVPRIVLGGMVGGMLAIAGAGYQGVLRNPLADPFLLGVAAGAGLGATSAIVLGLGGPAIPPLAFLGGLAGVTATYLLGRSVGGRTTDSLILAGVAVAAFLSAVQTYVMQRNAEVLREVYSWILGRLLTAGWSDVQLIAPYVAVSVVALLLHRRLLDTLAVGAEEAETLGVPTRRVRIIVLGAATLGTAAAVSVSGLIGFVGLVVPHVVRLLVGTSYRHLLGLSFLVGAAGLVIADLVARTIVAPGELPIGVVTAFVGAPFFTFILRRARSDR